MNIVDKIKRKIINSRFITKRLRKYNNAHRQLEVEYQLMKDRCTHLSFETVYDEPLVFRVEDNPLVSIVIPVYDQYAYTLACLYSILRNTVGLTYEIVLADDASCDETQFIGDKVHNMIIVRNENNLGFLRNVNHAAHRARGKYILLLNNDMQVKKNWLLPLVEVIEQDEEVGAVGGKMLWADGSIQGAGSDVFQDGRTSWRGERAPVDTPEFNTRLEVDYVAGCCLLLRRSDWIFLGGLDEMFLPAYYEDTDLCMRIHYELGKKIIYQPQSEIIHFHSMTYSAKSAEYMEMNRVRFCERWKSALENKLVHPFFQCKN